MFIIWAGNSGLFHWEDKQFTSTKFDVTEKWLLFLIITQIGEASFFMKQIMKLLVYLVLVKHTLISELWKLQFSSL